ncbi:glycoside hydrolase family 43 protein [Panaeolus papilionaceus]|nr:glycoside hydrolase family 43 protein [Panaeolus papilionaceus]
MLRFIISCLLLSRTLAILSVSAANSTFSNPILPGFHPDPSCIFVPEWDDTFFCASSSFNAFPGIPLHTSKDLQNWKLIGHALNRPDQLPRLAETNRSTSGIWAPALRFHKGNFYIVTTLVNDDLHANDPTRWDNMIFKSNNPYVASSWSIPKHFDFVGYDTSPFWDVDGQAYITGSHAWHVSPGIQQAKANIDTGEILSDWKLLWTGTGGIAPEGPHIFLKDGWYYLLVAEGGTGLGHMETMARSRNIEGPYEPDTANPVLTNANTTDYFQTVGHADLFQDKTGNWWGVALSTRSGPDFVYYPMGRETVLTPVTWNNGEFPIFTQVNGMESGWPLPAPNRNIPGNGPFTDEGDNIDFAPSSSLPPHFTYWRFPNPAYFAVSPPGHPNTLRVSPSHLNLTALNGNYAGPSGQAFVGRRQQDTLFRYLIDVNYTPKILNEEFGVTIFLTQNHHLDLGIVMLPREGGELSARSPPAPLVPHFRFRGISSVPVHADIVYSIPHSWINKKMTMGVEARNYTHYTFVAGPAGGRLSEIAVVPNDAVSWGFTGTILGVYCTSNGGKGTTPAYVSNWQYIPQAQFKTLEGV